MEIKINSECDECGTCISVCSGNALYISDKLCWSVEKCSFCARCIQICPFGALSQEN
ncbi:hypothetical protein CHISP_0695 [Chitinispirillum alkaliphilum]|nr:hypothetical protein CHISP_0695 [Chitinispirillum alkaliphilum]